MKRHATFAAIVVVALVFGAAGIGKLLLPASFYDQFAHLGLPWWWVPLTGVLETLGAVLIALPQESLSRLGATLLAVIMAAAVGLHLLYNPIILALPALLLMLLAGFVALRSHDKLVPRGQSGA